VGGESKDRFDTSAIRAVYEECCDDRPQHGSKKVSPKGPSSGLRMLTYFINRAGRGLSATRRAELQKAKAMLFARIKRAKESDRKRAA
jgi:hypothetical protein